VKMEPAQSSRASVVTTGSGSLGGRSRENLNGSGTALLQQSKIDPWRRQQPIVALPPKRVQSEETAQPLS